MIMVRDKCVADWFNTSSASQLGVHFLCLSQELVQDMVDYTHHVMDERIASGVPLVKLMAGGHSMVG